MSISTFSAVGPEVLEKATSGDGASLDVILSALSRPFYNLALRMLQNHEDAEDATQEALIRVATSLSTFRGKSAFSTWAWTVASRSVLDFRRGRARSAAFSVEEFGADLTDGMAESRSPDPAMQVYLGQVKLGCGRAMLQVLDGDHRLAYALVDILDLDQAEAAKALGISHPALRKRLSRARRKIREVLRRNCGLVAPQNPCRCGRRVSRALELGRLEPRDARQLNIEDLERQLEGLEELSRTAAYYRADPSASPSERLLPQVRSVLRLG